MMTELLSIYANQEAAIPKAGERNNWKSSSIRKMSMKRKKGKPGPNRKTHEGDLHLKLLTAIEISKLSPRNQARYYAQLVVENLNNSLTNDNSHQNEAAPA